MHIVIYAYYLSSKKTPQIQKTPSLHPRPSPPPNCSGSLSTCCRTEPCSDCLPSNTALSMSGSLPLWYLLFQRLNQDHSLDAALTDARAGGADQINSKLSAKLRSSSTASYSDARQRLPWQFLAQA